MNVTIFHHTRRSKSRKELPILRDRGIAPQIAE